jgi:ParB/Sulfiredoxin domain
MITRSCDSLVMPGLIEDLDTYSIRQSPSPRSEIIDLYELANSINQKGLLQPIIVRPKEGFFQRQIVSYPQFRQRARTLEFQSS